MRVGLPKALLWHKYKTLWTTFLEELGVEVITSSDGGKKSFDLGCRHCLDEVCLPIKTYYGHVIELKDKVDFLFIPKVISVEKRRRGRSYTCPKIIGLLDMIMASVPGLPKILSPRIDINKEPEFFAFFKLGLKICKNPVQIIRAYLKAKRAQQVFESNKPADQRSDKIKIGLVSHAYNLCGAYPTADIKNIMKKLGAAPLTIDLYKNEEKTEISEDLFPELSWNFEREMLGGAVKLMRDQKVSGLIVLTNFACGPDSLTGDFILRTVRKNSALPCLTLTVDEHTAEAGVKTRIEAFLDMIEMGSR
jgi:predicted nucleotide-binding protein (sugar kinase/HSP70/actin superfamily)